MLRSQVRRAVRTVSRKRIAMPVIAAARASICSSRRSITTSAARVSSVRIIPASASTPCVQSIVHPTVQVRVSAVAMQKRNMGGDAGGHFLEEAEVRERVVEVVKSFHKVDPSKVTPESNFSTELGLDSLDAVEVVMAFEDEFVIEIPDDEAEKINTIPDAVAYISTHPHAQ
jgi:NADH dehydrogenase (ubiquinone) 1 alpha/beta subcomplex 1, acyl-carrier protein